MRTIAVHPSAEMYGSDVMFLESVTAMKAPVLAVVPHEGPLTDALAARGIRFEVVGFPILRKVELRSPKAAGLFLLRFALAVPRLARWLRHQGCDALYVSTVIAPVWIYAARFFSRRPVACHVHESETQMSRLAGAVLLWPLRRTQRVIANSKDTEWWIARSTNERVASRTSVVYNGVAVSTPTETVPWPAGGAGRLVLVGRLSQRKGQDVAIRAVRLLRDAGHDVGLALVGDSFPGYEHIQQGLEQLVGDLELEGFVSFAGYQEPAPYVQAADVVLVPSRVEPFGLTAAEALMMAKPTVASNVGGLAEIITDGETGRLVEADDPAALAEAVAGLLDDPDGAAEMGRRGRADARARFSVEQYGRRLRDALGRP